MIPTIIKNKRGRFDGLDTKDKRAVAADAWRGRAAAF